MSDELWNIIEGYENYAICNYGWVMNIKTGRVLKQCYRNIYLSVNLCNGKMKTFYVHRLVAKTYADNPYNFEKVDHVDRDVTNNHFSNLRWVSSGQSVYNRAKKGGEAQSKYKGVSFSGNKWRAGIKFNYGTIHISTFVDEKDAARAYNEKAKELFGEHGYLNAID